MMNIKDNNFLPTGWPDEDWKLIERTFMKDPIDSKIVRELMKVLEEGEFHTPILLEKSDGEIFVRDGTHRVIASMLSEKEEIRAVWIEDITFDEKPLASRIRFKEGEDMSAKTTYDEILRSLPLDEKNWITSYGATRIEEVLTILWDSSDIELAQNINERVSEVVGEDLLDVITGYIHLIEATEEE